MNVIALDMKLKPSGFIVKGHCIYAGAQKHMAVHIT